MQTGCMLASNNLRFKYSLERIKRVFENVNSECTVAPERFRFFSKSAFLCGGRAQVFVSLFRKLKEQDGELFENAYVVFLYAKNLQNFEDLTTKSFLNKKVETFSKEMKFLSLPHATHAVVEVWIAGHVFTVDPSVCSIYASTVKKLRHRPCEKIELIDQHINDYNSIKEVNQTTSHRLYYATNYFYKTVLSQHYMRTVDTNVEAFLRRKRKLWLIKC